MNGLYFYKLVSSFPEDVTKDFKLTVNEIDHNFMKLKKSDISNFYLDNDKGLEISNKAIVINKENYELIENIINKNERYMLPIVYVTKTWAGSYPLNINKLSERLQGVAHVLKEN